MTLWRTSWNKWRLRARRTVPSGTLLVILLAVAMLNFLLAGGPLAGPWLWGGLLLALAVVSGVDYAGLRKLQLRATREVPPRPQLRVPFAVTAQVEVVPGRLRLLNVDLGIVQPLQAQAPLQRTDEPSSRRRRHDYAAGGGGEGDGGAGGDITGAALSRFRQTVLPLRRGVQQVAPMDCRIASPWGLWHCLVRATDAGEILVVPDLTTWRRSVTLLQRTLSQEGWHVKHSHVGDSEFAYVADYVPNDDPRRINWAATARRGRLMKNVYEAQQGQQLIVAVDASRYMQVELADGKTRLDYALEAAAALAYAAMASGDRVGLVAFTQRLVFSLPPRRDAVHWKHIVEQLAALEAEPVQGGYESLLRNLHGTFHRRSLLVVISELEGVESDDAFLTVLARTERHHPTLFVTLAEVQVLATLGAIPKTTRDIPRMAAASLVLGQRSQVRSRLQRQGVKVVESLPGDVVVDAVAAYLNRRLRVGQ